MINLEKKSPNNLWLLGRRLGYGLMILAAVYFFFRQDPENALICWALAAVFDPFNPRQPFSQRPRWQQAWLIVHALVILLLLWLVLQAGAK